MWEDKLKLYDEIVAMCPDFERKGKKMIYTSSNGYMFTLLNKAGEIGIRLSKESQKTFKEKHEATIYKSYGAVMKDYVLVPEHLYNDKALLASYFQESFTYVNTLKPK
ncbi:hypothetical protein [Pontimicrobium sp. MEBiC06410]